MAGPITSRLCSEASVTSSSGLWCSYQSLPLARSLGQPRWPPWQPPAPGPLLRQFPLPRALFTQLSPTSRRPPSNPCSSVDPSPTARPSTCFWAIWLYPARSSRHGAQVGAPVLLTAPRRPSGSHAPFPAGKAHPSAEWGRRCAPVGSSRGCDDVCSAFC